MLRERDRRPVTGFSRHEGEQGRLTECLLRVPRLRSVQMHHHESIEAEPCSRPVAAREVAGYIICLVGRVFAFLSALC